MTNNEERGHKLHETKDLDRENGRHKLFDYIIKNIFKRSVFPW